MNDTHSHENKTRLVVFLTAVTMVVEITYGIITNSIALLADGIHMGSHVGALGLSWLAYIYIRNNKNNPHFKSGTNKILSLSAFSSGIILLIFALFIIVQSVERFLSPAKIAFNEAIIVAIIGFIINIISAIVLHHSEEHSDHNIKAAYLHVLADTLTSLIAIVGLILAKYLIFNHFDTVGGLIGAAVIIKWAIGLLKTTGAELLDYKSDIK